MRRYFRIELLALLMIVLMLGVSYLIKVKNERMKNNASAKELEIFDSVTVEINASEVKSKIFADYTVKMGAELKMKHLLYTGKTAEVLKSEYGRSVGDLIYLDGNISLLQDNGYYYKAEHARYNKKSELLYVTSPFTAYLSGGTVIRGSNLKYDSKQKITTAETVDAFFFTAD